MIESISFKIATAMKKASDNEQASVDVIRFSLILILNTAIAFMLCLIFGFITGHTYEVMIALISFSMLRMFSGGYHLKTPAGCIIISVFTMVVIPFIPLSQFINLSMTLTSFLLMLVFAPSNIQKQTRVPERYFFVFKLISAFITAVNLYLQVDVIALAFFIQAISLIIKGR